MADNKEDAEGLMLKVLLKNARDISTLFGLSGDLAVTALLSVERCASCQEAATVRHGDLGIRMCDQHCARAIVRAQKSLAANVVDEMTEMRRRLADEGCWIDLEHAVRVRRLSEYVSLLTKNDEPPPPEHFDQLH
jgi:hypothetical protein